MRLRELVYLLVLVIEVLGLPCLAVRESWVRLVLQSLGQQASLMPELPFLVARAILEWPLAVAAGLWLTGRQ